MNCDMVFDILTRGPFPTGEETDGDVELHLARCHECRQLAEALRPAVTLLHESSPPEESRGLPSYQGVLAPVSPRMPMVAVRRIRPAAAPAARPERNETKHRWRRFLAAGVLGASLCLVFAVMGWSNAGGTDQPDEPPVENAASTDAHSPTAPSALLFAACRPWSAGKPVVATAGRCCTDCHTSGQTVKLQQPQVAALAKSCQACHR